MIDRPDWSGKFDNKGNELIPSDAPKSHEALIHEMETYTGPTGAAASTPAASVPATTEKRAEPGYDRQGNVIPATNEHGLPMEIAKEMHQSADGYDAQLSMMQNSAARVLQDMPAGFAAHFETLSPGIQTKAFRALRQYPHLGIYELVDKIQPTLTLSEMAEAEKWIQGLKQS